MSVDYQKIFDIIEKNQSILPQLVKKLNSKKIFKKKQNYHLNLKDYKNNLNKFIIKS